MSQGYAKSKRAGISIHSQEFWNEGMDALKDIMLRAEGSLVGDGVSYTWPFEEAAAYASYMRYDGYPKSLPPGKTWLAQLPIFTADTWKVLFDGEGTLKFTWAHSGGSSNSGDITISGTTWEVAEDQWESFVEITATNPADPIRNLRVFRTSDEATYLTAPWRDSFVALHSKVSVVRALDLMNANDSVLGSLVPHVWVQLKPAPQGERSYGDANTKYAWIDSAGGMGNPEVGQQIIGETSLIVGTLLAWSAYWEVDTNWAAIAVPNTVDGTAPADLFVAGEKIQLENGTYAYISDPLVAIPFDPSLPRFGERRMEVPTQPSSYSLSWLGLDRIVGLANTLDADLWLNIPICASDAMVTTIASTVASLLDGRRLVYIEAGNENWGPDWFSHYNHLEGLRRLRGGTSIEQESLRETARCVDIFRAHLGSARVRGIASGFAYGDPDDADQWITSTWLGSSLVSRFWAYAIAPYYGNIHANETVGAIQAASASGPNSIPVARAAMDAWKLTADNRGLRLVAYEFGITWNANGDPIVQQATSDYSRTGCFDDLTLYLSEWAEASGGALGNFHTDINRNRDDEDYHWGLGRSITDTATDKWLAWNDYVDQGIPTGPSTLLVEAVGHHEVRLTWDLPAPTDSMVTVIERGPSSSGPWEVVANVPQPVTQMVDQLPVEEATWWYRVGTEDDGGRSAYTDPVEYQLDLPDQENRGRPNRLHRRRPVWIKDVDELLDVYLGWPSPKAPLSTVQVGGT